MKKLILIFALVGIILIPQQTFAATINNNNSFQAKCHTYNVDTTDTNSIMAYFYYTYLYTLENHDTLNFMLFKTKANTQQYSFYVFSSDYTLGDTGGRQLSATKNCLYNGNSGNFTCTETTNTIPAETNAIHYIGGNVSLLEYTATTTSATIEDSYEDYCKIPNVDVNVDFPFTKEEYYVLLCLVATLIFMLFFKWCFPMKGGKKL